MDAKTDQFIHGICWMLGAVVAKRLSEKMKECLNNAPRQQYHVEETQKTIPKTDQLTKCMQCPYGPNAKEPPPPFFGEHPCFECDR